MISVGLRVGDVQEASCFRVVAPATLNRLANPLMRSQCSLCAWVGVASLYLEWTGRRVDPAIVAQYTIPTLMIPIGRSFSCKVIKGTNPCFTSRHLTPLIHITLCHQGSILASSFKANGAADLCIHSCLHVCPPARSRPLTQTQHPDHMPL